jgi:hypothetical protein
MPEDSKHYQLIIRQRPVACPDMDALLQSLQVDCGLDPYTARQRLIGPGLAMFGKGSLEKTGKIATLLHLYGYTSWRIEPQKPVFTADLLRSLEIYNDHILFNCQKESICLKRGTKVVGVLADISGELANKHVRRLLSQNTYRGRNAMQGLNRDEMMRIVLQGQPVFDFYLLDPDGRVKHAVQVMPGRFNVYGLGIRASMSSRQNLKAIVLLVEEYAGSFQLHCDFGLGHLPRCDVKRSSEGPSAVRENLDSLSRYGWLVSRLQADRCSCQSFLPRAAALTSGTALTVPLVQHTVDTMPVQGTKDSPLLEPNEVASPFQEVLNDSGEMISIPELSKVKAGSRDLPSPPERPFAKPVWQQLLNPFGWVLALGTIVFSAGNDFISLVAHYGMDTGVVPACAAFGLLWVGFSFVRLKRRVENTPTSKVRSIALGLVEVHGRALRLYALVSPMSQSACVWFRLRKYRKDKGRNWKLAKEIDSNHVPFQIDDGTGSVMVNPAGAVVKGKVKQTGSPGQPWLTSTVYGQGYDEDEKWVEDVIYEGTSLYILGFAQPLFESRMSLRERTRAKLRDLKLDLKAMHRYDTDGDGQIDEAEWDIARNDAEQSLLRESLAEGEDCKRQEEHVVIGKGPSGQPFIIAETASEAQLTKKYVLLSVPLLIAGIAATVWAIYRFLQFLKL